MVATLILLLDGQNQHQVDHLYLLHQTQVQKESVVHLHLQPVQQAQVTVVALVYLLVMH